jgi:hypothetical protein
VISFFCHQCRTVIRVTDAYRGKRGRCPRCSVFFDVPAKSDPKAEQTQNIAPANGSRPASKSRDSQTDPAADTDIDDVMPVDPNDETNRMDALMDTKPTTSPKNTPSRPGQIPALSVPIHRGVNRSLLIVILVVIFLFCAGVIAFVATRRTSITDPRATEEPVVSPTSAPIH